MSLLTLCAGVWCVAIGVLGLWLMTQEHRGPLSPRVVSVCAGIACLCAAQLVFLECVCERVFPGSHAWVRNLLRSSNALILGGSLCVLMLALMIFSV